jgi:2-polyprenyl-3-methyl-5-hydroxy-6-metoxy-1,4-benzoquinol methylase
MIRAEIQGHYRQGAESGRLETAQGELERLRTQDILRRNLPALPAVVFDVGGASGAYAFPLAAQGYQVHLMDPVPLHLEQARGAFGGRGS